MASVPPRRCGIVTNGEPRKRARFALFGFTAAALVSTTALAQTDPSILCDNPAKRAYDRAAGTDVAHPKSCIPLRCWTACWLQPDRSKYAITDDDEGCLRMRSG